jgi:DNA-binding IclR family transcriptional regulator
MKTVAKAIRLLKMFSAEHEEWGASELGRAVEMDKVIVHRLLRALAEGGLLVQDGETRRYRLGPGLIALVHGNLGSMDLPSLARPHLERLRDETGETILLSETSWWWHFHVRVAKPSGFLQRSVIQFRCIAQLAVGFS